MARKYPQGDVKHLIRMSAGLCAFPDCRQPVTEAPSDRDPAAFTGNISHIVAHSDNGPRGDPTMPASERDRYGNWILLCSRHHSIVDTQHNTHTKEDLRRWKVVHEKWVQDALARHMAEVTWAELEVVTRAILGMPLAPSAEFSLTEPAEKIRRNGLSEPTARRLAMGEMMAGAVQRYVQHVVLVDPAFPERLKAGFVVEYKRLQSNGVTGDALFEELQSIASGGSTDFVRQAAGLTVLTYLFEKCEVFEP